MMVVDSGIGNHGNPVGRGLLRCTADPVLELVFHRYRSLCLRYGVYIYIYI